MSNSHKSIVSMLSQEKEAVVTLSREIPPQIRLKTLDILRNQFKADDINIVNVVYLSEPERRNVLMRIYLSSGSELVPKSLILKQVLPQAQDTDDQQADARFARDWAGLEFTSRISKNTSVHTTPIFYGSDVTDRFILIEDLGQQHVSLVDSLTGPNKDNAVRALERYMKTLGEFHATSFGQTNEYTEVLETINKNATSSEQDLISTADYLLPKLDSAIHALDLTDSKALDEEIKRVLESMFNPGPFTVLTHGDIAPDNVFDGDKGLQLIDFEWCAPRNALLDGSYLRMSIPTGWCAKEIPDDTLKPLEAIYRAALKEKIPAASDDLAYSTAYTYACAFHVLHQMANVESILEQDVIWDSGPVPVDSLWEPESNSIRSRFLSRLQAFLAVATEHDQLYPNSPSILPKLRNIAHDMLIKVKQLWPVETKPLDFFPAFKQESLQISETISIPKASLSVTSESNSDRKNLVSLGVFSNSIQQGSLNDGDQSSSFEQNDGINSTI